MGALNHKDRAHALLSASGAKRWLACTPSARLEDTFPDTDTEFSKEGTRAHEIAEACLRAYLAFTPDPVYTDADDLRIRAEVDPYIKFVIEEYMEAKRLHGHASLLLEQRLDYSEYAQDGFGTGDAILLYADTIEVIDLKFGKGVAVDAEDNPQLRLYGLGALGSFGPIYDFDTVKMTIHQPRLDHVTSESLPVQELLDWAENDVKPKAELAYAGKGEYVPGTHCRFCKAAAVCRARAEENLALMKLDFKNPDILSDEEIAEVLSQAEKLAPWVSSVQEYALDQALKGVDFPGFKVVEGRSNRAYKNADEVATRVISSGIDEALIYERKLITLTAMEKVVGKKKFTELLGDLIVKPAGKPALVHETDPRPSYLPAASDFAGVGEVE